MSKASVSVQTSVSRIHAPYGRFRGSGDPKYPYITGVVFTHHGIVEVYSQEGYSTLEFVFQGRSYYRTFEKQYSTRYLITLAWRFVLEVRGGKI